MVLPDKGPGLITAAWKNELELKVTEAKVTAAHSPQSDGCVKNMVQTSKYAITPTAMDK